jgi:hypothetical protein
VVVAAAVAVLSPATSSKAIARAETLVAVVIREIGIKGIGVVVRLLVVVEVIIRASVVPLFAVMGKAMPILTSREVGDMTAVVVPLALGTVLWCLPTYGRLFGRWEKGRK